MLRCLASTSSHEAAAVAGIEYVCGLPLRRTASMITARLRASVARAFLGPVQPPAPSR